MTRKDPPDDLDKYLPDRAAVEAVMNGPLPYNRNIDPKLRERQRELNRLSSSSNPEILRPAPPSVTAYAEAAIREVGPDHKTLPRVEPKVELAVPPAPSEMPTQPSLKRLEGEPEVPGVVNGVPRRGVLGISWRGATLAVLTVMVPVLMVIVFMGRDVRKAEHERTANDRAASAARTTEPSPTTSVPLLTTPTAAPSAVPSPEAVPSEEPSAMPSATPSAAVPIRTGAMPKHGLRRPAEDHHDAPPATVSPEATAVPQVTPSATAIAPPVPPAPKGPDAPAQKPEF